MSTEVSKDKGLNLEDPTDVKTQKKAGVEEIELILTSDLTTTSVSLVSYILLIIISGVVGYNLININFIKLNPDRKKFYYKIGTILLVISWVLLFSIEAVKINRLRKQKENERKLLKNE